MPSCEIIAIGTELLLGEIQDTNTQYLARNLRDVGIDLYRTTMLGDNAERIAQTIQECMERAEIIITTGGLGPTVDDPTRQAVAMAVGVPLEYREDLWLQIQDRFKRFGRLATENNRRQAYIPQGAQAVENLVGTAPAFIYDTGERVIISLPGVPREMEYLMENVIFPFLKERYGLRGIIKALVLHASGIGESQVDELIGDLETLRNPTVGLLAKGGQIDIRITTKAESLEQANQLLHEYAILIRRRLGEAIFGQDTDTLESVVMTRAKSSALTLAVIECGLGDELSKRLKAAGLAECCIRTIESPCTEEELREHLRKLQAEQPVDIALAANLTPGQWQQDLLLIAAGPSETHTLQRSWGGPASMSITWSANTALDFLRRIITSEG